MGWRCGSNGSVYTGVGLVNLSKACAFAVKPHSNCTFPNLCKSRSPYLRKGQHLIASGSTYFALPSAKCKYGASYLNIYMGGGVFPGSSAGKESACNAGDLDSIPGLGRNPGRGHGNPLRCSCLENPHV